jgi:tRNA pseudouridine38-40 synthase
MTFKITIAYDGTDFVGWQRQASGASIQGLLEDALRDLDERAVTVSGAGRTDAGVHALGQVASFALDRSIEPATLVRALNARLPAAVRVVDAARVADTFHARFDATRKLYRYRMWNAGVSSPFERSYAWHVSGALDVGAMHEAAASIAGRHDFAAFQAAGSSITSTERELFSSTVWACATSPPEGHVGSHPSVDTLLSESRAGPHASVDPLISESSAGLQACHGRLIVYDVSGSGFLRHMVRNIVGSLVEIGRGRRPVAWMTEILDGHARALAGPTAPPHGLVLVAVAYGLQSSFKDA